MRYSKHFAGFALAAGLMLSGASVVSAADWRDSYQGRQEFRRDGRLRADIARDRARLDEDMRCRRYGAARRDRADLERDERALDHYGRRW
jgi:hypothetical protein